MTDKSDLTSDLNRRHKTFNPSLYIKSNLKKRHNSMHVTRSNQIFSSDIFFCDIVCCEKRVAEFSDEDNVNSSEISQHEVCL